MTMLGNHRAGGSARTRGTERCIHLPGRLTQETCLYLATAAVGLLAGCFVARPSRAGEPDVETVVSTWREYVQKCRPKDIVIQRRLPRDERMTESMLRYGKRDGMFLSHEITKGRAGTLETVKASNHDYYFFIFRGGGRRGDDFDFGPPLTKDPAQDIACYPLLVIGFNEGLSHLLADVESGTQRLANVRRQGPFVSVDLQLGAKDGLVRYEGNLLLDPAANYVLREGNVRTVTNPPQQDSSPWTFANEYRLVDGLAIPVRRRSPAVDDPNASSPSELTVTEFSLTEPPPRRPSLRPTTEYRNRLHKNLPAATACRPGSTLSSAASSRSSPAAASSTSPDAIRRRRLDQANGSTLRLEGVPCVAASRSSSCWWSSPSSGR